MMVYCNDVNVILKEGRGKTVERDDPKAIERENYTRRRFISRRPSEYTTRRTDTLFRPFYTLLYATLRFSMAKECEYITMEIFFSPGFVETRK